MKVFIEDSLKITVCGGEVLCGQICVAYLLETQMQKRWKRRRPRYVNKAVKDVEWRNDYEMKRKRMNRKFLENYCRPIHGPTALQRFQCGWKQPSRLCYLIAKGALHKILVLARDYNGYIVLFLILLYVMGTDSLRHSPIIVAVQRLGMLRPKCPSVPQEYGHT